VVCAFVALLAFTAVYVTAADEAKDIGSVIGIDLGTTYSCVGVYKDGRVQIIANDRQWQIATAPRQQQRARCTRASTILEHCVWPVWLIRSSSSLCVVLCGLEGNRITPSYVAFTDTERLIGDAAKNQAALNPENTVFDVKRLVGRTIDDKNVQKDMKVN
jgi:heat shock protein 5